MRLFFITLITCSILLCSLPVQATTPDSLTRVSRPWSGDLPDFIKERRPIRVLVSYNRTNYFLVKGRMRGLEYDLMQSFKEKLAKQYGKEHIHMVFLAVPFEDLIPDLLKGRGDIIAAGMTTTQDREKRVRFSAPYRAPVTEIVVGSKHARPITRLEDMAGKQVHVMAGSSYSKHLQELSTSLTKRGMRPITITEANPYLVTEDLLQMAQAGMIKYVAAEEHIARIWKSPLPSLRLFTEVPIHSEGALAWAVRPDSPKLQQALSTFAAKAKQGTLLGNMMFKRYFKNTDWVDNPNTPQAVVKLSKMAQTFQKYAREYGFDWLKLAALGYQESRLNMDQKSSVGAVGVMQIRPSTALDPNIGIKAYDTLDGNIHAGTKYLRFLCKNYFDTVDPDARVDFALAAYNAGPNRVLSLQKVAQEMGLNPNIWFRNVEWAAYREIGTETPRYVANVQMYYAAYKSISEVLEQREKAK